MAASLGRTAALAVALTIAGLTVTGCSGDGATAEPPAGSPSTPNGRPRPPDKGGPLRGLPECGEPPAPVTAAEEVAGLVLPPEAVVTSVQEQGQLVTVQGYVESTPVAVREFYQSARGFELVEIEDEVVEAEAVYADGDYRAFAKATASCSRGSGLLVVIGPAGDLPTPGGVGGPS